MGVQKKQFLNLLRAPTSCALPIQAGSDEVCVWFTDIGQIPWDNDKFNKTLSVDERQRSSRFVFERDRRRYIIRHAVLRMILSRYLALQPEEVSFRYNHFGKPMLENDKLFFSVSKSADCVVFAVTRNRRIGIDIEKIRAFAEMEDIARRFFSKPEYELLSSWPRSTKQEMFFKCWTRKEALIKAVGRGLSIPLHTFDISANPDAPIRLVELKSDLGKEHQWTICDLAKCPGFVSAVAIEGTFALPLRMHIFSYSGKEDEWIQVD